MKYKLIILSFLLQVSFFSFSQSVLFSQEKIDRYLLKNKEAPIDDSNKVYGAGLSIDGSIMRIVFSEFEWSKKKNIIKVKGVVYRHANAISDELRLANIQIFIASQVQNKLKSIIVLGYSSSENNKEGSFEFTFRMLKNSKLYFNGGTTFYLSVYDIWRLTHP
jgi:hypothetical protein